MDELVKRLREKAGAFDYDGRPDIACDYEQAADAIEELNKPRWIPATERLPDYGTTVLVYGSQGGIYTARYERARAEWGRDSWWKLNSKSHICNPTHWMPLPQPPKED